MDEIIYNSLLFKSLSIKKRFLKMYYNANAGHIGSSLSCAEILAFVFFNWMKDEDEFILSKGHAAACLYSSIAEKGLLNEEDIESFYKDGTFLAAHPPAGRLNKIPFATGSLGHGLSIAAGIGKAYKLKNSPKKVFCVTSDGELNEGSIWEAAQFINHHQLNNIIWLIDRNQLQGFGTTNDVMRPESISLKCQAFGFNVFEVDGHDFNSLNIAKNKLIDHQKPGVIICNTIKGRGWMNLQDTLGCHYLPFRGNDYENIIEEFEKEYQNKLINK